MIRSPQNVVAGLALVAVAVFAVWAVGDLSQGTLHSMGPAMMPRWVAIFIGIAGLIFIVIGLIADGEPLERWQVRGPFFICVGMILFALTIRTLGFLIAGPLSMIVAGYATPEVRKVEVAVFAIAMTVACIVLFVYVLDQSIPVLRIPGTAVEF